MTLLVLILLTSSTVGQPGQLATVAIYLPAGTVPVGSETKLPINIRTGGTEIGALQFDLVYDSALLEAVKVDAAGGVSGLTDFHVTGPGRVRVAFASSEPLREGEVFVATVRGLAEGQSSLRIENARAWERANSFETTVTAEPGTVTVGTPFPFAVIAGLVGLVVILLLIAMIATAVILKRKRRAVAPSYAAAPAGGPGTPTWASVPAGQPIASAPAPPVLKLCTCGQTLPADSRFCPACGTNLVNTGSRCPSCGGQLGPGARFCKACGSPVA